MKERIPEICRSEFFRAVLLTATTLVGAVLPIDFLLQIDSYVKYLQPPELLSVFAWAWLFYALFGTVIGFCVAAIATVITALPRIKLKSLVSEAAHWISSALIVLILIKGVKVWFEANHFVALASWLSSNQNLVILIVLLLNALVVFRHRIRHLPMQRSINISAFCGFIIALSSPVVLFFSLPSWNSDIPFSRTTELVKKRRPNIILITVDTLSANHMSLYGYARPTTPNLEMLARNASVFDRFYANGNFTTPGIGALINGTRPWNHRANQALARVDAKIAATGLIARLARIGYVTYTVWTNPIAAPFHHQNNRWTTATDYGRIHASAEGINALISARFPSFLPVNGLSVFGATCKFIDHFLVLCGIWTATDHNDPESAIVIAERMIRESDPTTPFFLWVHLLPPHSPYATPEPFAGRYDPSSARRGRFDSTPPWQFLAREKNISQFAGRYDEAISYVDSKIGMFVDWLGNKGLLQDTLLIVSADHGESFSHNYGGHGGPMLHEDLIRIPLIIKEPRQTMGKRLDTLSEQIDLMPTILNLADVPVEDSVEGRSRVPALRGEKTEGPVFSMNFEQNSRFKELTTGSVAMIEGKWKYVHYRGPIHYPMMPKLVDSLHDLEADPGENTNLIAEQPAIATRMRTAIKDRLRVRGNPLP